MRFTLALVALIAATLGSGREIDLAPDASALVMRADGTSFAVGSLGAVLRHLP